MRTAFILFSAAAVVIAQAGVPAEVRSVLDVIMQYGMAGMVLVVVYVFVNYLKTRDARDERMTASVAAAEHAIADKLEGLGKSIHSLDTAFRVAILRDKREGRGATDE